jgi:antirestriction protein
MTRIDPNAAQVYVGTYAKYNNGSIAGQWVNLEDCGSAEGFAEVCAAIHSDEADPEFMFQDYQNFPKTFYGESYIDPAVWEWLDLDDDDRELLAVYQDHVDQDGDIEDAREAYMGKADTEADWAYQWLDDSGQLAELPEWARNYFDFDAYARDARTGGDVVFARVGGDLWVFNGNV